VDGDTKKGNVLLLVSPVIHVASWAIIPRGVVIKKTANNVIRETTARGHHRRNKILDNVSGIQPNGERSCNKGYTPWKRKRVRRHVKMFDTWMKNMCLMSLRALIVTLVA
jgi:hypothetical protein